MIVPIITGATGTGKTALAIELALRHNAEIISADAYQVYRGMDIGTAKPSKEELAVVRHHLIDVLDPDQTYSAGDFFEHAEKIAADIISRGKLPIIAGGTGLYAETLIKGIFNAPERDDNFRTALEEDGGKHGFALLHERLKSIDPEFAASIPPSDKARIIRGLEINRLCKMNVREAQKAFHVNPKHKYSVFLITDERERMYARINERVVRMYEAGWTGEVEDLLLKGYNENMQSFKAIGYRETAALVKGEADFESVVSAVQQKTRNFAKRQVTWFGHMDGLTELRAGDEENASRLSAFIRDYWA
ncbi:tRNA (adenosine(37)-N6)-dimethylallyltransferase MiaA [Geovibrio thiophilus]|uniref:tRNA dimethylallyltransferase n=1 Tax=Geovibrio thiophilus TaxID=139438 RepID=A0A410JXI8_9BACT|nr:tRNA (adenosine(37)-N6)-dimethylallyltransferase MiaA [Geovibrio thiophilus]QAR32887.1 tRNA (adenosine(37)-N6)-dimethylallyltransferase MiaA [Geovibrio thiophilus]